ncbi:DegT/DnrJ/EryC1/StrS family aminotransferase [Yoonia sp. 2307UL14-13]|uniref:DegT/DnrJ/EryC1/StrS family aminotransferase n=1 Tax=Yoonia sp. 2307UL14-13 TaxID=3126506 RepID=UPI00309AE1B4
MTRDLPDVHSAEPIPARAMDEVNRILQSGDLFRYNSANSPVTMLEQDFAAMMGSRYALAVSSCSAAIFLALKALDLPPQARVLIPAFTFAAVPSAVVHAECVPVLCECGRNYRIDLEDFRAKLPDVSAVVISHMRGHTSDMDAILAACAKMDIPVIEDAAHSLGTTWNGRNIGTLGAMGCFSFQSYKLLNAGEGGILISDDPELIARAIIMSGAYEHNWKHHDIDPDVMERVQNKLPLYNMRLNTLSAVLIRAQLDEIPRRVRDGARNHDHLVEKLRTNPLFDLPAPYPAEARAPDSVQFNLPTLSDAQLDDFLSAAEMHGLRIQVFGRSRDNARAFWNWRFLDGFIELPKTRKMLMRACDLRLPASLSIADCDQIAGALLASMNTAVPPQHA